MTDRTIDPAWYSYLEELTKRINPERLDQNLKALNELDNAVWEQTQALGTYIRMKLTELLPRGTRLNSLHGGICFWVKGRNLEWAISIVIPTYIFPVWKIFMNDQKTGDGRELWIEFPATKHPEEVVQATINRVAVERFAQNKS